jgi:hypothetical protein
MFTVLVYYYGKFLVDNVLFAMLHMMLGWLRKFSKVEEKNLFAVLPLNILTYILVNMIFNLNCSKAPKDKFLNYLTKLKKVPNILFKLLIISNIIVIDRINISFYF